MRPERFEIIGEFLAIAWPDGQEQVLPLAELRRRCPCARCAGESDLLGRVHHPGGRPPLDPAESFRVLSWERVGNYAVAPRWADGHDTGIWSFTALRRLAGELDGPDG